MIPQNQSSLQIGVPDQVSRKTDPLSTRGIFNLPRVYVSTSPLSNYTREDNAITRGVVVVVVVGAYIYTRTHTYIACKKVVALTLSPPSSSLASTRIGPPLESISSIAAPSFASQSDRSSGIVIHDRRLDGYAGAFSKGKGLPSFLRFPRTRAPRSSFYRVPALSLSSISPLPARILHGIPSCSPPANLRALIKFSLGTLTERGPSFIKRRIKAIFP